MVTAVNDFIWDEHWGREVPQENIPKLMIEFTKLHVTEALKQASENVIIEGHPFEYELDKNSILNAYPLENIK